MSSTVTVRRPVVGDAAVMAEVHVRSWQETYRGLMSDSVLDDPGFLSRRQRFWTAALTDERYAQNRVAVAERDGEVVGVAMSGPPLDEDPSWPVQLYVLYLLAAHHGCGAGDQLLDAVVSIDESASLWVADPNPRAQAFYRKRGFRADGASKVKDGVREIRMTRLGGLPDAPEIPQTERGHDRLQQDQLPDAVIGCGHESIREIRSHLPQVPTRLLRVYGIRDDLYPVRSLDERNDVSNVLPR